MKFLKLQRSGADTQEQGKALSPFLLRLALSLFAGVFAMFLSAPSSAAAASNIYISQNGGGTGTSCSSASSVAWFNTSGNWGSGSAQIGPGTVVHLCGTITTELYPGGSGAAGNPVTILWEPGAALSQPAGTLISIANQQHFILDGGSNGIIENTANGTGLANQVGVEAIQLNGSGDIEIRNLTIENIYVHTNVSDSKIDGSTDTCVYANPLAGNLSFHDNTAHDVGWCLEFQAFSNSPTINIYNNNIYNMDHGLGLNQPSGQYYTLNFHDNHLHDTSNWDTTSNSYHHDGIHSFGASGSDSIATNIYNNLFDGNWGANNTSFIYQEIGPSNNYIYNNIAIASGVINDGIFNVGGTGSNALSLYNNTLDGGGVSGSTCLTIDPNNSSSTIENNAIYGCSVFVRCTICVINAINHNLYGNYVASGNSPWSLNGTSYSSFSEWQAAGYDASLGALVTDIALSVTGIPQTGSLVIGAGVNLTSLGITPLNSDTSAGNSRTPIARPSSGPWTIGAYESGAVAGQPAPPSGLIATVE